MHRHHRIDRSIGPPPPLTRGRAYTNRRGRPLAPWTTDFTRTYEQGFRIENTALAIYELYVGVNAPTDFSAPVATSATLPFSWTPPAGPVTLNFVVRLKNRYGLRSFNVIESTVRLDAGGAEIMAPLHAPLNVAVYDDATGYARVISKYVSSEDPDPATTFKIYAKVGSDPVPGVDPAVYSGPMVFLGEEAGLAQTIGPYTPGAVLHVIVEVARTADGAVADAVVVNKTLALALDLTDGFMFGGASYEQH